MSNVLIGIIGVILFIGLALAGALILGDDFLKASSSSSAAAYASELSQISNAANMYELKTGSLIPSSTRTALLKPRFLSNAIPESKDYIVRRLSHDTAYVYKLIPREEKDVCATLQTSYGKGKADGTVDDNDLWSPARARELQIGCLQYNATNSYIIFQTF